LIQKSAKCTVTFIEELCENTYALSFTAQELGFPKPGQFVHIKCGGGTDHILRRPISIADAFPGGNGNPPEIIIVFEKRGFGTEWLSTRKEGDELDVLGPLGNGFSIPESGNVLIVGGGIGVAPLLYAASLAGQKSDIILGYRSLDRVILTGEFRRLSNLFEIATDDGSYGLRGTVIDPVKSALSGKKYDAVLACGPKPMLKALSAVCKEFGAALQVSLEERMACGIGACLGCAAEIEKDGLRQMKRVCKDGPVFNAAEVVW